MGFLARLFGLAETANLSLPRIAIRPGSYPTNAVGEASCQRALIKICGYNRHGQEFECEAKLLPEPRNPHDANAVRVVIRGAKVGYLSREDAADYHERMASAGRPRSGARCGAKIVGGWRTNQEDEGAFGVRLGYPRLGPLSFE